VYVEATNGCSKQYDNLPYDTCGCGCARYGAVLRTTTLSDLRQVRRVALTLSFCFVLLQKKKASYFITDQQSGSDQDTVFGSFISVVS
jgi:uncharacterized protein YqkB